MPETKEHPSELIKKTSPRLAQTQMETDLKKRSYEGGWTMPSGYWRHGLAKMTIGWQQWIEHKRRSEAINKCPVHGTRTNTPDHPGGPCG